MCVELKIKSKHLGEEARIIRHEERKLKKRADYLRARDGEDIYIREADVPMWKWKRTELGEVQSKLQSIAEHRRWDVRNENRATFLARAFMKGTPYSKVEQNADRNKLICYILPRATKIVKKYHDKNVELTDLARWVKE